MTKHNCRKREGPKREGCVGSDLFFCVCIVDGLFVCLFFFQKKNQFSHHFWGHFSFSLYLYISHKHIHLLLFHLHNNQYLVAELLTDDIYVDYFLTESCRRLKDSYDRCILKLNEMVIPYIPAMAGMFVYADFSALLPEKTFEWEQILTNIFTIHARIVLTPGESQCDSNPGMFRICYAWVTPDILDIAMERLSRLVSRLRRMGPQDWKLAALVVDDDSTTEVSGSSSTPIHDTVVDDDKGATIHRAFAGVLD